MTTYTKRRRPILLDSSYNHALGLKYFIYSAFALAGGITIVPAIQDVAGAVYEVLWCVGVFLTSLFAGIYATKGSHEAFQKRELISGIIAVGFISVYSFSLVILALTGGDRRFALAIISLALLVMPIQRILFLFRKFRNK